MKKGQVYNAEKIEVLEGLEAVRLRPGMYIGTTEVRGLHHILWELVDNAVDEAANGFADTINVTLNDDGTATVEDNGRGIPIDKHPKLNISGVEVVFTKLHAGGKFNNENYSYSGGLHGVGASVTNALSEWLEVEVSKDGKKYYQKFHSFEEKGKIKSGVPVEPLKEVGKTKGHGTKVTFMPDKKVFDTIKFNSETISKRLKELAFLNKGIKINYSYLTSINGVKERREETYQYTGGLADFVKHLNEGIETTYDKPFYIEGEKDGIKVEFAFQHTNRFTESIYSYVNSIPTTEGGTHETGLKSALTRVFNDYARQNNILKEKDANLLGEDFREGMTGVLAIKMTNIQFEGQTKTKLGNAEARVACESIIYDQLNKVLNGPKVKQQITSIYKKAQAAADVRIKTQKAKDIARAKNSIENANLIGKLANCTSRKPENNEIFIVEGNSAGGSAKSARDKSTQAILPLRGKPLNIEKKNIEQILQNEEIRTIIGALGTGIGKDFDLESLKFHKVIILSDADQDGFHIRAILLTFFYRYMRELITSGHVYIGLPPLYKVSKKDKIVYAYSDNELARAIEEVGKGYELQRYKGLGEMNADQLKDTTMDPKTRNLLRVTLEDGAEAERLVTVLMGDAIEERRKYIYEHADFNKEDNFERIGG